MSLVSVRELKCSLYDPASILVLGELQHIPKDLIRNGCSHLCASELEQLLNDVIAKYICDERMQVGNDFVEHQVLERLVLEVLFRLSHHHMGVNHLTVVVLCLLQRLLYIPAAMLVHCTLMNMSPHDPVVDLLLVEHLLNHLLQEQASFNQWFRFLLLDLLIFILLGLRGLVALLHRLLFFFLC